MREFNEILDKLKEVDPLILLIIVIGIGFWVTGRFIGWMRRDDEDQNALTKTMLKTLADNLSDSKEERQMHTDAFNNVLKSFDEFNKELVAQRENNTAEFKRTRTYLDHIKQLNKDTHAVVVQTHAQGGVQQAQLETMNGTLESVETMIKKTIARLDTCRSEEQLDNIIRQHEQVLKHLERNDVIEKKLIDMRKQRDINSNRVTELQSVIEAQKQQINELKANQIKEPLNGN
jgi:hypothetical protein